MVNKKTLKDRRQKVKEVSLQAGTAELRPANITPLEAPPCTVSRNTTSMTASAGTAYTNVPPPQLAQPQLPADASSLRLVPIYDLNQLPIDWTTGDRFIPRLDKSSAALQNMRLIPIYAQNTSSGISAAPSSTATIDGNGGTAGTSLQQGGTSSVLPENAQPPPNADVLELKGNTNTKVQFILPEGLPPMVPALGGARRGPGTKICLEDNEDAQICMVPRDSVEESPLTSGEEITIRGNKKMQLFSGGGGGGGGGSSENVANDSNGEGEGTTEMSTHQECSIKAKADLQITHIQSSQIMGIPSAGASASSSTMSNIQNSQIMNVPSLPPYRPPTSPAYAAPVAQSATTNLPQTPTNQQEAPGSLSNVRWLSSLGLQFDRFREQVWKANKTLTSMADSAKHKITLSKPTSTVGFPRLLKRCLLRCTAASEGSSQECVVDVYESRLRIRSFSKENPLQTELNYSVIKGIKSNSSRHLELTDQDDNVTSFIAEDNAADDVIDIVSRIVSAVYAAYPEVPFQSMIPTFEIVPEGRYDIAFAQYKNSEHNRNETVGATVESVPAGVRTFSLADFYEKFPSGDIGLLKSLKYSKWFNRFNADDTDVTPACVECIAEILENNTTLEVIDFSQARLKPFSVQKLATALSNNPASKVVEINLSNNALSKKDVEALGAALAVPNRGFRRLLLEKSGITAKMANELLRGIRNNVYASTLTCLNLSGLKIDFLSHFRRNNSIQSIGVFLGSSNKLQELNLSGGGMVLEEIVDSLADGCVTDLRLLELSGNYYSLARSKPVPPKWKRFFSEAKSIDMIGFSNTRLPESALKALFEGLSENTFIGARSQGVMLDVSRNKLGVTGAKALAEYADQMKNIRSLDVTQNGFKNGLTIIFESFATHEGVKELLIGKNFTFLTQNRTFKQIGDKVPRILEADARNKDQAVEALIRMIKSDRSVLRSLDLSSSNLGSDMIRIIGALEGNTKIHKLNISGNAMGDDGAKALVDVLTSTNELKSLSFDRNNISITGLENIAQFVWRIPSLEVVLPCVDISIAQWENTEKAFELTEIFKLKASSAMEVPSNEYCSLQGATAQTREGGSTAEYAALTSEHASGAARLRHIGNIDIQEDFENEGPRNPKKSTLSTRSQGHNLQAVTSQGYESVMKTKLTYENVKHKNELDNTEKSKRLEEVRTNVPAEHVVEIHSERDRSKIVVDDEVQQSASVKGGLKIAPAKPVKPSQSDRHQDESAAAQTVSVTEQDVKALAEGKYCQSEDQK